MTFKNELYLASQRLTIYFFFQHGYLWLYTKPRLPAAGLAL